MWDRLSYSDYLSGTRKNNGTIIEYLNTLDKFHGFIDGHKADAPAAATSEIVEEFFESYNVEHMYTIFKSVMQCLKEYSDYVPKNSDNPDLLEISSAIKETFANRYKKKAIEFTAARKKLILTIPNCAAIDEQYLNVLDNGDFIQSFGELQNLIVLIYSDIENNPFEWGFPDSEQSHGYYHRVADFLFGFVRSGTYNDGVITVDTASFDADDNIKKHKKRDLVIDGLQKFGFAIGGYGKKSTAFTVEFPDNNKLLRVLNIYARALDKMSFKWITDEKYPCFWTLSRHKYSFSYRYIEDRGLQKHEIPFLIELDYSTEKGKETLLFVHSEAAKHGYVINANKPLSQMFHNSVIFKKADKPALYAGENQIQFWHGGGFYRGVTMSVFLKNTFTSEKEKTDILVSRFPSAFEKTPASMRTRSSYAGEWFWFEDLTLGDVKDIIQLHLAENE